MASYAEFRLVVTPDAANRGDWLVAVDQCPVPGLVGAKGSVTPAINRPELNTLRSREGWPNPAALKTIGEAVWQSVMTPDARAAFVTSVQVAQQNQQGLRIVIVLQGDGSPEAGPGPAIRLSELPVEALYDDTLQFVATDLNTPISRSLQQRPDREPQRVEVPLRLLVAVAAPNDKPPADVAKEIDEIKQAVADLSGPGGWLDVDVLEQATRQDVANRLKEKPYSIFHFIGHGGFEIVGQVETPRAYLCFMRPDGSGRSHPTDADTLLTMLRNTSVRLVVITACSSAAPTPPSPNVPLDAGPLGTGAFDGVAQRLVAGVSPVNAAVAMQFDLESVGAVEFSKAFYDHVLRPEVALDEAVTHARQALVRALEAGHRAWVTPTVYWRAQDGRVFDIDPSQVTVDEDTLRAVHDLDVRIAFHRAQVEKIAARPPEERAVLGDFREESVTEIERLGRERAELLGETVRLGNARATAAEEVRLPLRLRSRQPGTVALAACSVNYPADALTFVGADAGADAAGQPATSGPPGALRVVLVDPSGGAQWAAGEYELGILRFARVAGAERPLLDATVTAPQVTRNGQQPTFRPVDAIVFLEDAP